MLMLTPEPDPNEGLLCTRCGVDTDCKPDLTHMPFKYAKELLENWMCSDCLDAQEEADAAGAAEKNLAANPSQQKD